MDCQRLKVVTLGAVLVAVAALSAQSPNQGPSRNEVQSIVVGKFLGAELRSSFSSRKVHVNDELVFYVVDDLRQNSGVPLGSELVGHITELKARDRQTQLSAVRFKIDKLVFPDGTSVPFQAVVTYIRPRGDYSAQAIYPGERDRTTLTPSLLPHDPRNGTGLDGRDPFKAVDEMAGKKRGSMSAQPKPPSTEPSEDSSTLTSDEKEVRLGKHTILDFRIIGYGSKNCDVCTLPHK